MGGKKPPPLGYHRIPKGHHREPIFGNHMGYPYMGWWNMEVQRQKAEKNLV